TASENTISITPPAAHVEGVHHAFQVLQLAAGQHKAGRRRVLHPSSKRPALAAQHRCTGFPSAEHPCSAQETLPFQGCSSLQRQTSHPLRKQKGTLKTLPFISFVSSNLIHIGQTHFSYSKEGADFFLRGLSAIQPFGSVFRATASRLQSPVILMPKKNQVAVYELIFKEGVMVAKTDVPYAQTPQAGSHKILSDANSRVTLQIETTRLEKELIIHVGCFRHRKHSITDSHSRSEEIAAIQKECKSSLRILKTVLQAAA
ncbi:hypothetical protein A6R68_09268, partial [Neotoma lepida]